VASFSEQFRSCCNRTSPSLEEMQHWLVGPSDLVWQVTFSSAWGRLRTEYGQDDLMKLQRIDENGALTWGLAEFEGRDAPGRLDANEYVHCTVRPKYHC
jgi:hypothetical protein